MQTLDLLVRPATGVVNRADDRRQAEVMLPATRRPDADGTVFTVAWCAPREPLTASVAEDRSGPMFPWND